MQHTVYSIPYATVYSIPYTAYVMHHTYGKKTGQTRIKLASKNPKGDCTNMILRALKMNRSISFA